jgi:uncharacterized membrane protein YbaN (DUF454 family)
MHEDHGLAPPRRVTGLRRALYVVAGLFFVGLAFLGVFLPVLPTTPFLLLASFFFVRSSNRLNNWLLRSRLLGGFLRDWQKHRGVRLRVKVVALLVLVVAVAASAYFGDLPWYLVLMLVGLASIGAIVVLRLPVIRDAGPIPAEVGPVVQVPSGDGCTLS